LTIKVLNTNRDLAVVGDISALAGLSEEHKQSAVACVLLVFFERVRVMERQCLDLHEAGVTGDLSAVSGMTQLTQLDLDSTAVYLLR